MVRILIADDRELVRTTIAQLLRRADPNWSVCGEAADGIEAVRQAVELSPDLIVLDVAMPRMDGVSATREIRALLPDIPILLYTFYSLPHLDAAAKQAGANGVVQKGDSRTLIAEIRRLLAGAKNSAQSLSAAAGSADSNLSVAMAAEASKGQESQAEGEELAETDAEGE